MFCKELELAVYTCSYSFVTFYLYLILINIMYVSYCYISYKCCNAIQETRIPSEIRVGKHYITDGKHASLVICVWGTRIPRDTVQKHFIRRNTHPYDNGSVVLIKLYPLCYGESFHPSLLPFLFDWWMRRWEIAEEVLMNCTPYTYYVKLMTKCTCAWLHHLLRLLLSSSLLCTDSSQPGWFQVETYAHSWAVICQYSWC